MKNKQSLVLMEILVMVLVFAMASAVCLRVFFHGEEKSRENTVLSSAIFTVQTAAETVKIAGGDLEKAADKLGAYTDGGKIFVNCDEKGYKLPESSDDWAYRLEIEKIDSDTPLLGLAEVRAADREGNVVFSVTAAYGEVA